MYSCDPTIQIDEQVRENFDRIIEEHFSSNWYYNKSKQNYRDCNNPFSVWCDERFKVGQKAAEIIHGTPSDPFAVIENRMVPTSPYHHVHSKTIGESWTIVSSANRNKFWF
jgi:hypothetical protein